MKDVGTPQKPDEQFYWEWALHEDILFTNRVNFFLIAEAMLLTGVAALLSGNKLLSSSNVYKILCCAGIFTTLLWLYVSMAHFLAQYTESRRNYAVVLLDILNLSGLVENGVRHIYLLVLDYRL